MVGFAKTAKIAAFESTYRNLRTVIQGSEDGLLSLYVRSSMVHQLQSLKILTIQIVLVAYWGEINTKVHKGFGMSGAFTNGVSS